MNDFHKKNWPPFLSFKDDQLRQRDVTAEDTRKEVKKVLPETENLEAIDPEIVKLRVRRFPSGKKSAPLVRRLRKIVQGNFEGMVDFEERLLEMLGENSLEEAIKRKEHFFDFMFMSESYAEKLSLNRFVFLLQVGIEASRENAHIFLSKIHLLPKEWHEMGWVKWLKAKAEKELEEKKKLSSG